MMRVVTSLVILLVIAATLAPRLSAAVGTAFGGTYTVVICTGTTLETITLDADGNPVERQEHSDQPCALHALGAVEASAPALWQRLARSYAALPFVATPPVRGAQLFLRNPPAQGPPVIG